MGTAPELEQIEQEIVAYIHSSIERLADEKFYGSLITTDELLEAVKEDVNLYQKELLKG